MVRNNIFSYHNAAEIKMCTILTTEDRQQFIDSIGSITIFYCSKNLVHQDIKQYTINVWKYSDLAPARILLSHEERLADVVLKVQTVDSAIRSRNIFVRNGVTAVLH